MYFTWTEGSGLLFVPVSQQQAQEKEPSTLPPSLGTTWLFMVRSQKISCISEPFSMNISCCRSPPGGNVHIHYQEEKCYDEEIFFYHLGCHQWVSVGDSWSLSEFWNLLPLLDTPQFSPPGGDLLSVKQPLIVSPVLRWGVCQRPLLTCRCCDGRASAAGGWGLQRRCPRRSGGLQSSTFC